MTYDIDDLYERLPNLEGSPHRITSPPDDQYNCVAWVRRELSAYYAPGLFWPHGVAEPKGDEDLDAFIALFTSWGYEMCESAALEPGFLKIAIYARSNVFHHVAKQLPSGAWSSKVGEAHDLRHETLHALEDAPVFFDRASAIIFMRKPCDGLDDFDLEERGYYLP